MSYPTWRCRAVPCAAEATHIVTGDMLTRAWVARPAAASGAVARYCRPCAEARAARLTQAVQPPAAVPKRGEH